MTMYAGILLLAVLGPVPVKAAERPNRPAHLPIPSEASADAGPFIGGGSWGVGGIRFQDGSVLILGDGTWPYQFGLTYSHLVYQSGCFRSSLFTGARVGMTCEYYLGDGLSARLDLGAPFLARASLDWYPVRGIHLSMGYDLLLGRLQGGWMFIP
jgi:hypothetical protein